MELPEDKMLYIECKGTPYEIGQQHGQAAKLQIDRCIAFYADLFLKNCKKQWPEVQQLASAFEHQAKEKWPAYHDEMRGVADGAKRELLDIVALNVRTEINFGLFSDGCTALAWHTDNHAWLAQNWDVTEAGIIGKIGFNSSGIGTLLNAIKVHGVDESRLPVHFGLRMALESPSVDEAVKRLKTHGMAASAHILLADASTCLGLEFTKSTFAHCVPDSARRVLHTNHLLLEHAGESDTVWLQDSLTRLKTMEENAARLGREPGWKELEGLFEDEQNAPGAICRTETKDTGSATLFNIVMDLKAKKAVVRLGRPSEVEESIELEL